MRWNVLRRVLIFNGGIIDARVAYFCKGFYFYCSHCSVVLYSLYLSIYLLMPSLGYELNILEQSFFSFFFPRRTP